MILSVWFFIFISCVALFLKDQNIIYWILALFAFFALLFNAMNEEGENLHIWFIAYSTECGGVNRTFIEIAAEELKPSDIEQIEAHIAQENHIRWVSVVNYKYVDRV